MRIGTAKTKSSSNMIHILPKEISNAITSSYSFPTVSMSINSFSRGATSIYVEIDFLNFFLRISDDGLGMKKDDFDIDSGFSLSCVQQLSGVADISLLSKSHSGLLKYTTMEDDIFFSEIDNNFEGTIICVANIYSKMKIRQNFLNIPLEFMQIRSFLRSFSILHYELTITFSDLSSRKDILYITPSRSMIESAILHTGNITFKYAIGCCVKYKMYSMTGYITPLDMSYCMPSKSCQVLFVNNIWVASHKDMGLSKLIDKLFCDIVRRVSPQDNRQLNLNLLQGDVVDSKYSPGSLRTANICQYCGFILHIECPASDTQWFRDVCEGHRCVTFHNEIYTHNLTCAFFKEILHVLKYPSETIRSIFNDKLIARYSSGCEDMMSAYAAQEKLQPQMLATKIKIVENNQQRSCHSCWRSLRSGKNISGDVNDGEKYCEVCLTAKRRREDDATRIYNTDFAHCFDGPSTPNDYETEVDTHVNMPLLSLDDDREFVGGDCSLPVVDRGVCVVVNPDRFKDIDDSLRNEIDTENYYHQRDICGSDWREHIYANEKECDNEEEGKRNMADNPPFFAHMNPIAHFFDNDSDTNDRGDTSTVSPVIVIDQTDSRKRKYLHDREDVSNIRMVAEEVSTNSVTKNNVTRADPQSFRVQKPCNSTLDDDFKCSKNMQSTLFDNRHKNYSKSIAMNLCKSDLILKKIVNNENEFRRGLTVVNQVDDKYIFATCHHNKYGRMLVCIDQHAAHERVILEELTRETIQAIKQQASVDASISDSTTTKHSSDDFTCDKNASVSRTYDRRDKIESSMEMRENLWITAKEKDHILYRGVKLFKNWGYDFTITDSKTDTHKYKIMFRKLPIIQRVQTTTKDFMNYLHLLIDNAHTPASLDILRPPAVQVILAYRACRSAIKFGDTLDRDECQELLDLLVQTDLPFQCAHGRPSIVPITIL